MIGTNSFVPIVDAAPTPARETSHEFVFAKKSHKPRPHPIFNGHRVPSSPASSRTAGSSSRTSSSTRTASSSSNAPSSASGSRVPSAASAGMETVSEEETWTRPSSAQRPPPRSASPPPIIPAPLPPAPSVPNPNAARAAKRMLNPPSPVWIARLFSRSWDHNQLVKDICTYCRHPYLSAKGEDVLYIPALLGLVNKKYTYKRMMLVSFYFLKFISLLI